MMDPVHLGRHHDRAQNPVDRLRQKHVSVIEHRGCIEQHLEDQDRQGRRSQSQYHAELDNHGQQDLDRMKPHAGRDIEFEIGMMHPVQAPQRRHGMKQNVLKIDREIKHYHSDDHSGPSRQRQVV